MVVLKPCQSCSENTSH